MQTRHVVFALIGVAVLVLALLVGLFGGCMLGGMFCGLCGLAAGQSSTRPYVPPSPVPPRPEIPTPRPLVRPTVPAPLPSRAGALIVEVIPGSPADQAGLRPGDIITSVDRQQLSGDKPLADVLREYRPGDEVVLGVLQAGQVESVRVRLGESPNEPGRAYLGITYRTMMGRETAPSSPSS